MMNTMGNNKNNLLFLRCPGVRRKLSRASNSLTRLFSFSRLGPFLKGGLCPLSLPSMKAKTGAPAPPATPKSDPGRALGDAPDQAASAGVAAIAGSREGTGYGSASRSLAGLMLPELVSAGVAALAGPREGVGYGSASRSLTILTDMSSWQVLPGARQRRGSGPQGASEEAR